MEHDLPGAHGAPDVGLAHRAALGASERRGDVPEGAARVRVAVALHLLERDPVADAAVDAHGFSRHRTRGRRGRETRCPGTRARTGP
ncbi:MAG: hypothetical protein ACK55I_16345, partial [bacterium]